MRAVVAERPDGPDGLVVRDVPRPEPRPGWALVRVEAFGLNRSEYKTLKGYAGDAVSFPRILGIELVGVVEAVHGDAPAVPPGETVAALMGEMGRAFDGGYAEYALVPEHQLIALDTTLPWEVLGALPETFVTAAGSLQHLGLQQVHELHRSGGDRDFMRTITDDVYRIPPERVIGSSNALRYLEDEDGGTITYA